MSLAVIAASVSLIACHGGPADHFATFAEELAKKGHTVQIYAAGPAYQKFRDRNAAGVTLFSVEGGEQKARELAEKCAASSLVITDVGHIFDVALQEALARFAPQALRVAYYDNPESYVPGGYSETAAKVMLAADRVLFANANFEEKGVKLTPSEEVPLLRLNRVGLGYYPMSQAAKIAQRREGEREAIRARLFERAHVKDVGQRVLVYTGGNNDVYFSQAFPAFLKFLKEVDPANFLILFQQHPGAKKDNIDGQLLRDWAVQMDGRAQVVVSPLSSDDAQVVADGMIYYQTSMGPQFVLAGIPTIQAGHNVYPDLLVTHHLCQVATDAESFGKALSQLDKPVDFDRSAIEKGLGIREEWVDRLEGLLTRQLN